jgi:hypothetical protein
MLKKILPIQIVFALFTVVLIALYFIGLKQDYTFLFLINILLWLVSSLSLYLYFNSLKSSRPTVSITAINGTVMLKLVTTAVFILVYHKMVHPLHYITLLYAFIMYVTYSIIQVNISTKKTNSK